MATARRNQTSKSNVKSEFLTAGEFIRKEGFIEVVNGVRWNKNDYPYLTFLNPNNEADNVYFSVAESENYPKEFDEDGNIIPIPVIVADGFFDNLTFTYATNKDGIVLPKICGKGSSKRESLLDLL